MFLKSFLNAYLQFKGLLIFSYLKVRTYCKTLCINPWAYTLVAIFLWAYMGAGLYTGELIHRGYKIAKR